MNKILTTALLLLLCSFNAFADYDEDALKIFAKAMDKEEKYETFENTDIQRSKVKLYEAHDDDGSYQLQCHKYKDYIIMEYGFNGNCCSHLHQVIVTKYTPNKFAYLLGNWKSICTKEHFADELKTFPFKNNKFLAKDEVPSLSGINGVFRKVFTKGKKTFLLFIDTNSLYSWIDIIIINESGKVTYQNYPFAHYTKNIQKKYAKSPTEFCYANSNFKSTSYMHLSFHTIGTTQRMSWENEMKFHDIIKELSKCQAEELYPVEDRILLSAQSEIQCLDFATNKIRDTGETSCFYME